MDKKVLVRGLIIAAALFVVTIVMGIVTPLDSFGGGTGTWRFSGTITESQPHIFTPVHIPQQRS